MHGRRLLLPFYVGTPNTLWSNRGSGAQTRGPLDLRLHLATMQSTTASAFSRSPLVRGRRILLPSLVAVPGFARRPRMSRHLDGGCGVGDIGEQESR